MNLKESVKNFYSKAVSCLPLRPLADPKYFEMWEKKGVHITPDFCYSPIPHLADLNESTWDRKSQLVGIDMNRTKQVEMMRMFSEKFASEYNQFPKDKNPGGGEYYLNNCFLGPVDAEVLYSMVRHLKPAKVLEIGSGFSTYLTAKALLENEKNGTPRANLTAVECNPNPVLKNGFPGLTRLIDKRIEEIDMKELTDLNENDIFFIDSSHTVRIGGDVTYLFLEILPRLKKGVYIHVHDIFFPDEYPKEWIQKNNMFWAEQYLLQAFLMFNQSFEVVWCGNMMHKEFSNDLEKAFRSYDPKAELLYLPKSFWMRKTA